MINATELMPFEKFASSVLKLIYHNNVKKLRGSYRDSFGIHREEFWAHPCGTAIQTYEAYLMWFNYTNQDHYTPERFFISAVWVKNTED